jgi:hypothetical protein
MVASAWPIGTPIIFVSWYGSGCLFPWVIRTEGSAVQDEIRAGWDQSENLPELSQASRVPENPPVG